MGIINKEGALYFATGIDNTGLYSGRREAIGIIKAMASQITSFDVFGGIGISAGIAFARAAKGTYDFEKQFQQSMKEVATISNGIKGSLTEFMNQVLEITKTIPVQANDAAKALYQIVSAGHDGADGMKILEVSAKAAIGGVTDTATAADAITTVLNAYKMDASKAQEVSDQLFTTVRLGKTDFGLLGKSIAQAAPIAASFGIDIKEVLAAAASVTKQGVPTAEAFTKIRAAILGTANYLGDAAFKGRTFQEALQLIYDKASGSSTKMKEFLGTDEALQAALMVTGQNAKSAAKDLEDVGNSAGAAEAAFKEMVSSAQNQLQLLQNNITAALRPMGEAILKEVSSIATAFNTAFENGDVQESMKTLGALIVTVTSAFIGYKGSILAVSTAKQVYATIMAIVNKQRTIEIGKLVLSQGFYDAETASVVKNTSSRLLLTKALRAQFVASMKASAAMLTNPYVLAAGAVAFLGYTVFKLATAESAAERATRRHKEEQNKFRKVVDERRQQVDDLLRVIKDETETEYAKVEAYKKLQELSPALTTAYNLETLAVLDLAEANKILNAERDKTNYDHIISQINKYTQFVNRLKLANTWNDLGDLRGPIKSEYGIGLIGSKLEEAQEDLNKWVGDLDKYNRLKNKVEEENKPIEVKLFEAKSDLPQLQEEFDKAEKKLKEEREKMQKNPLYVIPFTVELDFINAEKRLNELKGKISSLEGGSTANGLSFVSVENKSFWTRQKDDATKALDSIASSQKKLMDAGKFEGIDATVVKNYKDNVKKLKEAEKELKVYDSFSNQESVAEKLRKETEQYKLLLDKNKREEERLKIDSQHELEQIEIDGLQEGSEKTLRQRKLNHEKELEAIRREAEDKKLQLIENARSEFEANPANAKKSFDADKFIKSEPVQKEFKKIEETRDVKIKTSDIKYNRGDDFKGLLDEYQGYTDKRLAIEKKFNDDIAILQEARRKAEAKGDKDEVAKIDRSKAQATKNKGEDLMRLDYEQLKKSPEYVRAFENLKQTSTNTLTSLLSQLEAAKQTAAEVLNPEDLREYTFTIQSIVDELTERNPFQTIISKKKELAQAEKEMAEAKKQLDDVNNGKKIVVSSHYNKDTNKIEFTYLTVTEALKKYNKAKDHVVKTDSELQVAEKKVSEQVDELGNALKNIGGVIGGTSGEIISLMGDIYSFTSLSMEGISKLSGEAAKEMSALEKASVILGIISAAIQILQELDSLIGDAHSQYEGYAEKIAEINKLTDAVNEYRIAALEAQQAEKDWFSEDKLGNLRNFRQLHEEIANAYDEKANEKQAVYQNESGGGWLTKTFNWVMGNMSMLSPLKGWRNLWEQGDYDKDTTEAINNLRIETRKKSKGFLGTGIGGHSQKTEDLVTWARNNGFGELFDKNGLIDKEAGKAILDKYGDKLVGQTKETLESLLELSDKYDEYFEQLHEYVNSLYEPLVDNFVDSIWDWLDTGKDALSSFKDYASDTFREIANDMLKSIVLSKIFGEGENSYQNKINKAYDDYAKGLIDEVELNRQVTQLTSDLMGNAEEQLPVIQSMADNIAGTIKDTTGIDIIHSGGSSSQSSTSGYSTTASQESIDETNGRLTGVQMGVEEIKEQARQQTEIQFNIIETMKTIYNLNYEHYTEIQDMTQNSLNILEDINKDTKQLYQMNERLGKIEQNTRGLS